MVRQTTPRPAVESLEGRALFAITPTHVALAERSVAEVVPVNNVYYNGTPDVTWSGIDGETATTVKADCTTYVTVLLKKAYQFSNTQWASLFGSSSPSLTTYYNDAVADIGFDGFKQIADAKVGDYFICKYPDGSDARGHMVMLDAPPTLVSTSSTKRAYNATIIDVTGSVHTNDTRNAIDPVTGVHDTGVGRGNIRFYTDLAGNLTHWAWGTNTTSTTYDPTTYPCTFAHVPAPIVKPYSPSNLRATADGETTVNLAWSDNSSVEDGYVVQRSSDGGSTWSTIGDTTAAAFTDATATPGAFNYRVYGVYGNGQSNNYATASVTVNPVIPAQPTYLAAKLVRDNVYLSWVDNATNEVRYVVERSVDSGAFATLTQTTANVYNIADASATTGHFYTYRVRAESLYAVSGVSNTYTINRATRGGPVLMPIPMGTTPTPVARDVLNIL